MEGNLQKSPKLGCRMDSIEAKSMPELSTILVATIQDTKERVSQIEYIFCSLIYPKFQSKSESLQKIYSEVRKAADDAWKEKENDLLLEMKRLQLEKQQALEENQFLKLEKAKPTNEQEEKLCQLLAKLENQQLKIDELEQELMQKSKEVDEGMVLQNKILQMNQSKSSMLVNQGRQLKEYEEKISTLISELSSQQRIVDKLQEELREKTEELARKKEVKENPLKKIEMLISEITSNEQLLTDHKEENKFLLSKLEGLEKSVGRLQGELRKKTEEVEDGRKLQEQLLQQIDLNSSEMLKSKQQLEECEKEKKLLLSKVEGLEEKVDELKNNLSKRSGEADGGRDTDENLLKQIELKSLELMAEKKKRKGVVEAYKKLKHQYNFLLTKLPQEKSEYDSDSSRRHQNLITSLDHEDKDLDTLGVDCYQNKVKNEINFSENLDNEKGVKSIQNSSFHSPASNFIAPKCPSSIKSAPAAGRKRPASSWRDTRSRPGQGGPDPHDDFLDTPLENIRGNLTKAIKQEINDLPVTSLKDMNVDSSDDETQDMNVDPGPQRQQLPDPTAGRSGFKYVEPVRKKADREKLKGVECKQCKKFYDAVLPDNGGKDGDGSKQIRCEHHEGVSRHRYKYVPPLTPEGFWNIGFESEM